MNLRRVQKGKGYRCRITGHRDREYGSRRKRHRRGEKDLEGRGWKLI